MTTTSKTSTVSSPPTPSVPPGSHSAHITLHTLRDMKKRGEPIAMLTAYDFPTARLFAAAGIELLLVGDSVATTVLGHDSTLPATMDLLVTLTGAVRRGAPQAFVMGDMPFASYPDVPTAVANASRFIKEAGADGVKLEADIRHCEMVTAMSAAGMTVCAHVGLLPQRAPQQGGYFAQGRTPAEARRIVDEALQLARAGAQLLLLEAVPDEVTAALVRQLEEAGLDCPVLGCGAGPSAHGHVLVSHDMLGYGSDGLGAGGGGAGGSAGGGRSPRFVERFGDVPAVVVEAAQRYRAAVKARQYPALRHQYVMKTGGGGAVSPPPAGGEKA